MKIRQWTLIVLKIKATLIATALEGRGSLASADVTIPTAGVRSTEVCRSQAGHINELGERQQGGAWTAANWRETEQQSVGRR